jgi:HK97 family phage prohead protease
MIEMELVSFDVEDLELREADGHRYVAVKAVPYEREIALTATRSEVFSKGAFAGAAKATGRIPLAFGHPTPLQRAQGDRLIGVMSSALDGPDGFRAEMKLAKTPLAEEALALVDVGALRQVSVGFRRIQGATQTIDRGNGRTLDRHHRAGLDHIALVRDGAYGEDAMVEAVRDDLMRLADLAAMIDRARRR